MKTPIIIFVVIITTTTHNTLITTECLLHCSKEKTVFVNILLVLACSELVQFLTHSSRALNKEDRNMRLRCSSVVMYLAGLRRQVQHLAHTQNHKNSRVCCHMPEIQVSGRLSQEHLKFEARLGDLVSSCLTNKWRATEKHIHHQLLFSVYAHLQKTYTNVRAYYTLTKRSKQKTSFASENTQNSILH